MSRERQTERSHERDSQRGNSRMWWIVGGVVLVVLVGLFAVVGSSGDPDLATRPSADGAAGSQADVSGASNDAVKANPAAYVEMRDFDGNAISISDLVGRPVVVNFWATWCPACFAEMPAFEKAYQANRESIQFLGINLSEDRETALSIVEETGVTYPLARDPQGEVFAAFGGYGMPTTVFLDENGAVVGMYTGELTTDELDARISEYFEG